MNRPKVLVTAFDVEDDPYEGSSITLQTLLRIGVHDSRVQLVGCGMPMIYHLLSDGVDELMAAHKPILTVHIAVNPSYTMMFIEQQAANGFYILRDVAGMVPRRYLCVDGGPLIAPVLKSKIDMQKVVEKTNSVQNVVPVGLSTECGRALSYNQNAALIHIPTPCMPYTPLELAVAIQHAIVAMLEQVYPQPPDPQHEKDKPAKQA